MAARVSRAAHVSRTALPLVSFRHHADQRRRVDAVVVVRVVLRDERRLASGELPNHQLGIAKVHHRGKPEAGEGRAGQIVKWRGVAPSRSVSQSWCPRAHLDAQILSCAGVLVAMPLDWRCRFLGVAPVVNGSRLLSEKRSHMSANMIGGQPQLVARYHG